MVVLICLVSIVSIYLLLYYAYVDIGAVYVSIYDSHEHVKVIEKSLVWTTIAYMDMQPGKVLTLAFITQYTKI